MSLELSTHHPDGFFEEISMEKPFVKFLIIVFTVCVFFLGVFGNCFILATVSRKRTLQTPLNWLLVNLAIADIFCLVFIIAGEPLTEVAARYGYISEGVKCSKFMFFSMVGDYFPAFAIAVPLVIYSFYQQITSRSCSKLLILLWAAPSSIALYDAYYAEWTSIDESGILYCIQATPHPSVDRFMEHFNTFIFVFLPVLIASSCVITHKVLKKSFLDGTAMHRLLLLMVAIFTLFLTPVTLTIHFPHYTEIEYDNVLKMWKFTRFWSMLCVVYKPILLIMYHEDFSDEFWYRIEFFQQRNKGSDVHPLHNDVDL